MKAAMVGGQEAEDDRLSWRVEAEVKLRLEGAAEQQAALSAALSVRTLPAFPL